MFFRHIFLFLFSTIAPLYLLSNYVPLPSPPSFSEASHETVKKRTCPETPPPNTLNTTSYEAIKKLETDFHRAYSALKSPPPTEVVTAPTTNVVSDSSGPSQSSSAPPVALPSRFFPSSVFPVPFSPSFFNVTYVSDVRSSHLKSIVKEVVTKFVRFWETRGPMAFKEEKICGGKQEVEEEVERKFREVHEKEG